MRRVALQLKCPLVNFSSILEDPGVPTVRDDVVGKGRLCAEHLLARGFHRFAVVMPPPGWLFRQRLQGFLSVIKQAGFGANVEQLQLSSQQPINPRDLSRFRRWIKSLQVPAGLFLVDDLDAPALMRICCEVGRQIPRDVGVVAGLGHEEVLPFCEPALTHVRGNDEAIAARAAELLDQLMDGAVFSGGIISVPAQGLIAQASTDTVALDDPVAAGAVEYIRAHAGQGVNIKDLVNALGFPRRTIERHFQQAMGGSLHQYLTRERVERARELVRASPSLSLREVARRCGFADARRLNLAVQSLTGCSLVQIRSQADSK